jgi:hypothetical protein
VAGPAAALEAAFAIDGFEAIVEAAAVSNMSMLAFCDDGKKNKDESIEMTRKWLARQIHKVPGRGLNQTMRRNALAKTGKCRTETATYDLRRVAPTALAAIAEPSCVRRGEEEMEVEDGRRKEERRVVMMGEMEMEKICGGLVVDELLGKKLDRSDDAAVLLLLLRLCVDFWLGEMSGAETRLSTCRA